MEWLLSMSCLDNFHYWAAVFAGFWAGVAVTNFIIFFAGHWSGRAPGSPSQPRSGEAEPPAGARGINVQAHRRAEYAPAAVGNQHRASDRRGDRPVGRELTGFARDWLGAAVRGFKAAKPESEMTEAWDVPTDETEQRELRSQGVARKVVSNWYRPQSFRARVHADPYRSSLLYGEWKAGKSSDYEPGSSA